MADHLTSAPLIEVGVLGPLVVVVAGAPVSVSRGATSVLLEILALDPEPISSTAIAVAVEASIGRSCSRATVHTAIWRLRRGLGSDQAIVSEDGGYRLNRNLCSVDADTFDRAVAAAQRLAGEHEFPAAAREFARAISLWRGPLDVGLNGDPRLAGRALRLEDRRAMAMEGWTDALRMAGQPDDAARILERLVVEHPLREQAWTALLGSYADAGRATEARSAFDRARLHLAEHGLEPGAGLRAALAALEVAPSQVVTCQPPQRLDELPDGALPLIRALDELVMHLAEAVEALADGLAGGRLDDPDGDGGPARARRAVASVQSARAAYESSRDGSLLRGSLW